MADQLSSLTVIFSEFYYWIAVVLMFLTQVGFSMHRSGASRWKNHHHSLLTTAVLIPILTLSFFLYGWWIYFAVPAGPGIAELFGGDGVLLPSPWAEPWSELMGAHLGGMPTDTENLSLGDTLFWSRTNGVLWAVFLLFSWTVVAIVAGAVIERIRPSAFYLLAIVVGSFCWIVAASWGWQWNGWMVAFLGYHDAYAAGVVHATAGGFALGILVHLGPRLARFRADGTPRSLRPISPWLSTVGLFFIYVGLWGFYIASNVPILDVGPTAGMEQSFWTSTNIYFAPTTLSAMTFNFILALTGGLTAAYVVSKGDAFWTYSGGLAGLVATSAGNDLYHPLQALLIGAAAAILAYKLHHWVERRFRIDDGVGAVAVHGYAGVFGVIAAGFMLWGYPSSMSVGYAHITPWGQLAGAAICFLLLGFLPAWIVAGILKYLGVLRIPAAIEIAGLDFAINNANREAAEEMAAFEQDLAAKIGGR